jgi:hypothetical protein
MEVAPLLPPIPLPSAFQIPGPTLDMPLVNTPRWTPIPPRIRDIPGPGVPQTEPKPEPTEEPVSKPPPVQPAPQIPPTITPELPPLPVVPPEKEEAVDNVIIIPLTEVEIPLPSNEVMITTSVTATVAAVASVGAALIGKTFFDYLLKLIKPLLKIILKKLSKARGKPQQTWARQRLEHRHKSHKTD